MKEPEDSTGGQAANRGFYVQTLVALLRIVRADEAFTEITLEGAQDKFDFVWRDAAGKTYAVQVKSTKNLFTEAKVMDWALEMQGNPADDYTLILVGNVLPGLPKVDASGKVDIQNKPLDLVGLQKQAAQEIGEFIAQHKLPACTAPECARIVDGLVGRLGYYASTGAAFSYQAFITLLSGWINTAPRQERKIDISRILPQAPDRLFGREAETALLDDAWNRACICGPAGAPPAQDATARPLVLAFVAQGGEGKTALVAKWATGPTIANCFLPRRPSKYKPDQKVGLNSTY